MRPIVRKIRCAVYTRKSSEEGLEMEFNSLDAQREACEAYIVSQRAEGWIQVDDRYDDGGVSGGTIERPALKRLLADVQAGRIDVVAVYKIDRLSRSMLDFLKLIELFERHKTTFVSVTQSFNTTDAMGRMHLNIMMTFAQFEREVIGERIRDKFAASRKKGMWMGGWAPFGYEVRDRKLVVNEADAATVRSIFKRFLVLKSATLLAHELRQKDVRNRYGQAIDKGVLYRILKNRTYVGDAVHKGTAYAGEHEVIIDRKLWDRVHAIIQESPRARGANSRAQTPALLKGLIFDATGAAMSPTHTRRKGRLYRYYISQRLIKAGEPAGAPSMRVPAGEIEEIVVGQFRRMVASPEIIVATWKQLRGTPSQLTENEVRAVLVSFDEVWDELFPAEQQRITSLLVDRVVVFPTKVNVHLVIAGFTSLVTEMKGLAADVATAA
ncbi:recombinase family protein [Bradyrhizobium sp. JYMT SZCCT0180]|uniref:recombinase family protein n=1 Tax=Bradyrhizobium sp. JYMT SZCCT0180 TaxID=2807666 RepID=UPI001BAC99EE|nr:recombinase family protein [Bradyrhizobium sp. JYMT SZCCT0180]MBR1216210.1 recombinase family protein [Bradyrhizobium sp. JYMT SZCCT0180]